MTLKLTPQRAAELLKELQYAKVQMGGQLSIRDEYFKQALEKQPQWYRLCDTKPKVGQEVIIFNGMVITGYLYTEFDDFESDECFTIGNATHWMPLPEAPL